MPDVLQGDETSGALQSWNGPLSLLLPWILDEGESDHLLGDSLGSFWKKGRLTGSGHVAKVTEWQGAG
jgi:hypothetical protein